MKKISVALILLVAAGAIVVVVLRHGGQQQQHGSEPKEAQSTASRPAVQQQKPVRAVSGAKTTPTMKPSGVVLASPAAPYEKQFLVNLSANVRSVVGLDANKGFAYRTAALQTLGVNMPRGDIEGIYAFLSARYEDHKTEMDLLEFESVRNDALDLLLRQAQLPPDLVTNLVAIFHDREQNEVWRDYSVQHFEPYCQAKWKETAIPPTDPDWIAISNAYFEAVTETDSTIAGTALLGMERLSSAQSVISRDTVGQLAVTLANDEKCGEPARITALRICGQLKKIEILPTARFLSQTADTISLQIAAIATLGDLGDASDREYLESTLLVGNQRLHPAAKAALQRLPKADPQSTVK